MLVVAGFYDVANSKNQLLAGWVSKVSYANVLLDECCLAGGYSLHEVLVLLDVLICQVFSSKSGVTRCYVVF